MQRRGRGHRLEPGLADRRAAALAPTVGSRVELHERVVDLLERLEERAGQGVDLAALGGDLAGVGEALVEVESRPGAAAELAQLLGDALALVLQLGAQRRVGQLGHEPTIPAHPAGAVATGQPARARGWARS